jgi:hypothetical protein
MVFRFDGEVLGEGMSVSIVYYKMISRNFNRISNFERLFEKE